MSARVRPLVLVQCDAFDPTLTHRWMDDGTLPALAALRARGAHAELTGPERVAELGMALSAYTGVSRARHGYYDYRQLRSGTYDLYAAAAQDAGLAPFWASLTDLSVVVLDAGETEVIDGLRGAQLVNWTAHQSATRVLPPRGVPHAVLAEARRSFGPAPRISEFLLDSRPDDDRPILTALLERVRRKGALCRQFVSRGADLVVLGFFEGHTAGHRFWKYHRGRSDGGDLADALRAVYRAIDHEIGELLARMPDANVVVFSLFGMHDEYPTEGLMESFCRTLGYQAPAGPPGGRTRASAPRRSFTSYVGAMLPPSLRAAISRRLPTATQERLLANAFRVSTDWSRTVAFSIPSLYTGHVRVNLRGREPAGIVEPGADYRDVLARIDADLRKLEDPLTGGPAIRAVHHTATLFPGALPDHLPDLFVEWESAPQFREQVVHPRGVLRQAPPAYYRDSFHRLEGFMLAAGPDIAGRPAVAALDVLDIAPTCLALLGRSPAAAMTGKAARTLLSAETR